MLKAILYYILFIAEFIITIFFGGFLAGLYTALFCANKGDYENQETLMNDMTPFVIAVMMLTMLIIWGTFSFYKFSKFSLGKVVPAHKWKAMLYTTLPIFGITLVSYSAMNYFHLDFLPKDMANMGYLSFLPFALVGAFISAYVFYGAIQEELIRCGKKKWVQLLTLVLMMLPASLISVTAKGDISLNLTLLGIISTCYSFWIYGKTRSSIILFVLYFCSNLVPYKIVPPALSLGLMVIGIILTIYGFMALHKNLPTFINQEEA